MNKPLKRKLTSQKIIFQMLSFNNILFTGDKKTKSTYFLLFGFLFLSSLASSAATITSTGTGGAWDTAATWVGNNVPTSTDDVVIAAGATVTGSGFAQIVNLTINGTLTMGNNDQLNLTGDFTINGTFNNGGGASDVLFNGNNALQTISGNNTDFNTISVDKGSSSANILNVTAVITMISDGLSVVNGTFKLSSASTLEIFSGNYSLTATCGLWNNGGNITTTSGGNLTLGGVFKSSAGSTDIGDAIDNQLSYLTGSTIVIDGGSVTIAASFRPNTTGTSRTTYTQTGGVFTCGELGSTVANVGIFDIRNTSSIFTMSGGDIVIVSANPNFSPDFYLRAISWVTGGTVYIGNASTPASQTMNINCTDSLYNLVINSTNSPIAILRTNTLVIKNNLTINSGATLDLNTENMFIGGNWVNNGTFTPSTRRVTFYLGQAQSISGTNTFYRMTINKTANAITINNDQTISNNLTFTDGVMYGPSNELIFLDGTTLTTVSDSSHFVGQVKKIGNNAFTFPTGNGSYYASIRISAPASVTDEFTAQYFDSPFYKTDTFIGLDHVSTLEHWILNRTNGTSSVNVTLSFSSRRTSDVDSSKLSDLRVARWNGSEWVSHGNGATTFASPSGTVRTGAAVSSFSPFTLGSVAGLNPLPVNWISFKAKVASENQIDLDWLISETETTEFHIEKSLDGKNWLQIGKVKSNVSSAYTNAYQFADRNPVKGMQYYRIEEMTQSGHFSYSAIVPVLLMTSKINVVNVYPNPVGNIINISLPTDEPSTILVVNTTGQKVIEMNNDSRQSLTLDLSAFEKGVYMIEVISNGNVISREKIIKL